MVVLVSATAGGGEHQRHRQPHGQRCPGPAHGESLHGGRPGASSAIAASRASSRSGEHLQTARLSLAHRPQVPDPILDHGAAAGGPEARDDEHRDLIAALEELLGLDDHLLEGLEQVLEEPPHDLAAAIGPGIDHPVRRLKLELRVREADCGVPVPRLTASYPTRSVSMSACDIACEYLARWGRRTWAAVIQVEAPPLGGKRRSRRGDIPKQDRSPHVLRNASSAPPESSACLRQVGHLANTPDLVRKSALTWNRVPGKNARADRAGLSCEDVPEMQNAGRVPHAARVPR